MSEEKTEAPSAKKLREARRDGKTAKSSDIPFAACLLGASLGFALLGPQLAEQLRLLMRSGFAVKAASADSFSLRAALLDAGLHMAWLVLPLVLGVLVVSLGTVMAQVGFMVSFKPITPKLDTLNPVNGLKRIFSVRSAVDLAKAVVKASVIGAVLWQTLIELAPALVSVVYQPLSGLDALAWNVLCHVLGIAALLFAALGVLDYRLQRWLFLRDQRMSKSELKREHKETEGNPQIKGQRRRLAHENASAPLQAKVAQAQVVLVNPTHVAVALRYAPDECGLPRVIAKGADAQARLIREQATRAGVPIIGNPPLARALFQVPLEHTIPEPLFDAVATVLSWVEKMSGHSAT
ncbi:type III secretion system export apparatus subunit SctU [Paraburkholderia bonniea]|uniref:type III secretion system export apparatus subunit SctU n=1 Tax=Paraburkholderia bonniea TaxID=2152891 RepID=UPI001292101F|nr:type III secretion system export apparatus subunit SctU [Paraburkholderia bonniea]WJF89346.1 type III secretion system export apparatus subunit SctU [Paraburkholderia bonniea]WJF92662.1 type III secretion system export apparatus subunit SctU [Paraburkholderia bonniea]